MEGNTDPLEIGKKYADSESFVRGGPTLATFSLVGSKGSILQYFRPSLSYHLSLRSLYCLFLSGRLR